MNIKPTQNPRKITYPTLAALVTMVTLSACQEQPQRIVGKFPAKEHNPAQQQKPTKTEPRILVGRRAPAPLLGGAAVPTNIPATLPKPTEKIEYQGPPGEPPAPATPPKDTEEKLEDRIYPGAPPAPATPPKDTEEEIEDQIDPGDLEIDSCR